MARMSVFLPVLIICLIRLTKLAVMNKPEMPILDNGIKMFQAEHHPLVTNTFTGMGEPILSILQSIYKFKTDTL